MAGVLHYVLRDLAKAPVRGRVICEAIELGKGRLRGALFPLVIRARPIAGRPAGMTQGGGGLNTPRAGGMTDRPRACHKRGQKRRAGCVCTGNGRDNEPLADVPACPRPSRHSPMSFSFSATLSDGALSWTAFQSQEVIGGITVRDSNGDGNLDRGGPTATACNTTAMFSGYYYLAPNGADLRHRSSVPYGQRLSHSLQCRRLRFSPRIWRCPAARLFSRDTRIRPTGNPVLFFCPAPPSPRQQAR